MSKATQKSSRSKIYVDPEVQMALARRVAAHWLLFMFVCFLLIGVLQAFIEHPSTSFSEMFNYALRRNIIPLVSGIASAIVSL